MSERDNEDKQQEEPQFTWHTPYDLEYNDPESGFNCYLSMDKKRMDSLTEEEKHALELSLQSYLIVLSNSLESEDALRQSGLPLSASINFVTGRILQAGQTLGHLAKNGRTRMS